VKEAEQREENEDASGFHREYCFIFWNFLKRIPTTVFLHALTVQYALPVTFAVSWCICALIDKVRYLIASLEPRCTQHRLRRCSEWTDVTCVTAM